jgi:hypothetical protein
MQSSYQDDKKKKYSKTKQEKWCQIQMSRELLGNVHHDGLRVDGILQVSMRYQIPIKQKANFHPGSGPSMR